MWLVCSRRLLRVEELQEAVAFDSHDKSWNCDKIPDADRMIKSCHGLVVRDKENDNVRLAHHTVQQYLVSAQGGLHNTGSEGFEESTAPTARVHFWPELHRFRCDPKAAEVLAGTLCMTYLCFSDFSTAVSRIRDDRKIDLGAAFKDRGLVSIPAALGLGKHLGNLPYMYFGARNKFKMPDIDYLKYLDVGPRDRRPSPDFRKKFALLEYVIEYWPWHTMGLPRERRHWYHTKQFWDLVQHGTLAFEFRPWGSNQHSGHYGCRGCPVPEPDEVESKDLPSMGLLHWAAETGHLSVLDMIEPPLRKYLNHERYHDETLLIACRHGQLAFIETLLDRGTFDLSDGRAMVAACASGNVPAFYRVMQYQEAKSKLFTHSTEMFSSVGPRALYQAASNGHKDVVEALLMIADTSITDAATGLTPLQIAAKNGHSEVVGALLTRSYIMRSMDDGPHKISGMKALHYAAENGFNEIVTLMVLEHNFDYEVQDLRGETALIKAARNGQAVVVNTLLQAGADPSVSGGEVYSLPYPSPFFRSNLPRSVSERVKISRPTAAHHAAANGHESVIAILPLPYSDWRCGNEELTALLLGAAYGHTNAVRMLLSKGAGTETRDRDGMTALHYAALIGHTAMVQLLLDKGCKLEARTNIGLTALHMAAYGARTGIIRTLIAHGAAIGVKTLKGRPELGLPMEGSTPLHIAASYADADTIRTLVDCGAPLEEETDFGWTALDEAINSCNLTTVVALTELGAKWLPRVKRLLVSKEKDPKIAEILLNKISASTVEEQRLAGSMILETDEGKARKTVLDDWAKEWARKQKLPRHRR